MVHNNDIDFHDLQVKILENSDDLTTFNCSDNDAMGLNVFIHSEALQFQREKLGVTYLFLYNNQVVGFVTVAMSQIELKLAKTSKLPFRVTIKYYPAMIIGRLGVDNNYRRRHIGTNLCLWCLYFAKEMSEKVGCRVVVVLTDGDHIEFYKKCNFDVVTEQEKKKRVFLYLKIP